MANKDFKSKTYQANPVPEYVGWFRPHLPVKWTGEKLDRKTGELVKEPSRTKQSFKAECDINNIVKSFRTVQDILNMTANNRQGVFTDLPDPFEYQDGLNVVIQAEASFAALPSSLRNRFENDPKQFLDFMSNPANQDEWIKLGLATDNRPPPTTEPVPPSTPPTSEPPK